MTALVALHPLAALDPLAALNPVAALHPLAALHPVAALHPLAALNPLAGIGHMLSHPFMRYAFSAGTAIALASGLIGYFVVLRGQVFTADALSHVAFTGALAALAAGISLLLGLYVSCVVVALAMAALGVRGRADDTVIGSVFAWILGLGALFLTMYTTSSSGTDATSGVNVLFGSIFGLSSSKSLTDALVSLGVVAVLLAIARPLLFASLDEAVAAARGVPVRTLGFVFLGLVGITAAAATQAVGALLLLGLIAAPAGTAQRLSARPFRAFWLSAAVAVASMWGGLTIAYAAASIPPSFAILAIATGCYLIAYLWTAGRRRAGYRASMG
jgi:zinc/manganese transport system permease protein